MLQLYRVFVHSQELLKVISVGPHFFCTEVYHTFCVYTLCPGFHEDGYCMIELKSHQLVGGFVLRDFCTFGKFSVDVLTSWQKSECTSGRGMHGFISLEVFHWLKCHFAYNISKIFLVCDQVIVTCFKLHNVFLQPRCNIMQIETGVG